MIGWLGDHWGPRWTVGFGVVFVAVAVIWITLWIMRSDHLRVRFDRDRRVPWLRIDRGITEDMPDPRR